jgi:hypothetical protein
MRGRLADRGAVDPERGHAMEESELVLEGWVLNGWRLKAIAQRFVGDLRQDRAIRPRRSERVPVADPNISKLTIFS